MNKFLSLILTLVLVLNVFVGAGIFAFAEGGSADLGDEECTHTDGVDDYDNVCDDCKEYIGTNELVVGENTVMMTDYYENERDLIKFVPAESDAYYFYSTMTENDPRAYLFDSDLNELDYNDDGNGYPNFGFVWQLEAGKTYYLSVVTYEELVECSVVIEKHVHSGGVETCKGLLCDCGNYYGETTYEHRLDTTQTCIGYQCFDCEEYLGEGSGIHYDSSDEDINICYYCGTYIGQDSVDLDRNTISVIAGWYVYISFVPYESATYRIYSQSEYDPKIYVFNSDFEWLAEADDENGTNFSLLIDLETEKTYYLAIYEYDLDYDLTFYVEKHEHSGGEQTCMGYLCDCGYYYGEASDHTDGEDQFGDWCDTCFKFLGTDLALGKSTVICGDYENEEWFRMYRFIPSESGKYAMTSVNGEDPIAYVYEIIDGEWQSITSADDNFNLAYRDFSIVINLEAGKEYYFGLSSYDDEGEFEILFVKHDECTDTVAMCNGVYCTVCGQLVNNTGDEATHIWWFGKCHLCNETIPEDYAHEHVWNDGDCKICDDGHDCKVSDWDEDGYCKVCEEDAGFKIIRNGKLTYYRGLTAVIEAMQDGDLVVMLEDRYISADYTIDADVTFDLNGCTLYFDYDEDTILNVYGDVTFVNNSPDDEGYIEVYINVYGDVTFISGIYYYIELCNGQSFADVIPECSDVYQHDGSFNRLVDISEYALNYAFHFDIVSNGEKHVAKQVVTEATCTTDAVINSYCVYCEKHLGEIDVLEDTATGHQWIGIYGEGQKVCTGCDETKEDVIYSGNFGTELGEFLVTTAYEFLKDLVVGFVEENLSFIYE